MPNKCVMDVKIMMEAGFEPAMEAIALNKKKYDKDMYPVSKKLYSADGGHNKFLEMISVWIDYTTCRSIHQQIDTYRVGVTKSSESTHHMLIEDVLNTSINVEPMLLLLKNAGYSLKISSFPINGFALLISKHKNNTITNDEIQQFVDKFFTFNESKQILKEEFYKSFYNCLYLCFKIDYDKYYAMFEGGSESITKETVDIMVDLAMSLEEDRYGKLHKLKRMLPEGFLQRRIMHTNYKGLRTMLAQRWNDPFNHWVMFCDKIYQQVEHPEYFEDLFEKIRKPMIDKGIPLYK